VKYLTVMSSSGDWGEVPNSSSGELGEVPNSDE